MKEGEVQEMLKPPPPTILDGKPLQEVFKTRRWLQENLSALGPDVTNVGVRVVWDSKVNPTRRQFELVATIRRKKASKSELAARRTEVEGIPVSFATRPLNRDELQAKRKADKAEKQP